MQLALFQFCFIQNLTISKVYTNFEIHISNFSGSLVILPLEEK